MSATLATQVALLAGPLVCSGPERARRLKGCPGRASVPGMAQKETRRTLAPREVLYHLDLLLTALQHGDLRGALAELDELCPPHTIPEVFCAGHGPMTRVHLESAVENLAAARRVLDGWREGLVAVMGPDELDEGDEAADACPGCGVELAWPHVRQIMVAEDGRGWCPECASLDGRDYSPEPVVPEELTTAGPRRALELVGGEDR